MFGIFGDEARRHPGHFPLRSVGLTVGASLLVAVVVLGSISACNKPVATATQVSLEQTGQEVDNPPAQDTKPQQEETAGEVTVEYPPLPVVTPTILLKWGTFLGDPGLPPTPVTRNYYGWDIPPYSSSPTEGGVAVAVHILPELEGFVQNYRDIAQGNTPPVYLNIQQDGKYIFATIFAADDRRLVEALARGETPDSSLDLKPVSYNYVFLSIDGGETWEPANQVLIEILGKEVPVPTLNPVWIKAQEGILLLYQMDKPYKWWVATVEFKDLPT